MKPATALVLAALGFASLAGALLLRPLQPTSLAGAGQKLFPGVAAQLPKASRIEIEGAASLGALRSTTLILRNGTWSIAERGGFRAQPPKLRELLAGLTELTLREPRTADPENFARLGVNDPASPNSTASLLRVKDEAGTLLAAVILGHRSQRSGGQAEQVFVRIPGQTQSWLAEGHIPADSDPQAWLVREIIDLPGSRIATVTVQNGADHITFAHKPNGAEGMTLTSPPPPGRLEDDHIDAIGTALEGLTLADVRPLPLPGTPVGASVFTLTDGLAITVTLNRDDKTVWASLSAAGPGAEAYGRLNGWAFQLPEWRQTSLVPAVSDLVANEPAK